MRKLGEHSSAESGCLGIMAIFVALFFIFAFIGFLPNSISRPIKSFLNHLSQWVMGS